MAKTSDIGVMSKLRLELEKFGRDVLPYNDIGSRKGLSNEEVVTRTTQLNTCLDFALASMIASYGKKQSEMLKRQMQSNGCLPDYDRLTPGLTHIMKLKGLDSIVVTVQVNKNSDGDIDKVALDNLLRRELSSATYAKVAGFVRDCTKTRNGARTIGVSIK